MMKRRFLALLMALAMLLSMSGGALAEETEAGIPEMAVAEEAPAAEEAPTTEETQPPQAEEQTQAPEETQRAEETQTPEATQRAEETAASDKAQQVVALIDAIGEVTLDSEDAILAAEAAYTALSDEEKSRVSNYAALEAAMTAYAELSATPVNVPETATSSLRVMATDGSGANAQEAVLGSDGILRIEKRGAATARIYLGVGTGARLVSFDIIQGGANVTSASSDNTDYAVYYGGEYTLPVVARASVKNADESSADYYIIVAAGSAGAYAVSVSGFTADSADYSDANGITFASLGDQVTLTPVTKNIGSGTLQSITWAWTTSDATVATVDENGVVTCIGDGTASITAKYGALTVACDARLAGTLTGSGTQDDPYRLATAEDLETLRTLVAGGESFEGKYLVMTADITLPDGWKPIGETKDGTADIKSGDNLLPFSGNLDGKNHMLTVPDGGLPLLGYVKGASVSNLNIYGRKIAGYGLVNNLSGVGLSGTAISIDSVTLKAGSSTLKSGLIGAETSSNPYAGCSAGFTVSISNCVIENGVTVGYGKDQSVIGGIAGRVNGTISGCTCNANVYGSSYVGGILGMRDNAMGNCAVSGCSFGGSVSASGMFAGGIVGGGYNDPSAPNGIRVNVSNCTATGSVSGSDKVGGILGGDAIVAQAWNRYSFTNNSFTGKVSSSGSCVGGIIGYYRSLNKFDDIAGNYYASACGAAAGIGKVDYVDTSCATHETESGALYFNTETSTSGCPEVAGCDWKKAHNRTDDPLGADLEKLVYTDGSTVIDVTGVKLDKSELSLKENATATLKATVTPDDATDKTVRFSSSNESVATVSAKGVVTAKAVGTAVITATAGKVSATCDVTVTEDTEAGTINVYLTLIGDSKHGSGKVHTLATGGLTTWMKKTKYNIKEGSTVWTLLKKCLNDHGWSYSNSTGNYVASVRGLGEFDNGKNSGWMYTLNGKYPLLGVSEQKLKDGDKIVFHYTDDYTLENTGFDNSTGMVSGGADNPESDMEDAMVTAVIGLIDNIGTVSLDSSSKAKIDAARKAYNKLSDDQKELVTNYDALADAIATYVKLSGQNLYSETGDLLGDLGATDFEEALTVLGLLRSGREADTDGFMENAAAYFDAEDVSCTVDALRALMQTAVDRMPAAPSLAADEAQTAMDMAYLLIADHASGTPSGNYETLAEELLGLQLEDGGWATEGETADVETTALVLTALAYYYDPEAAEDDEMRLAVESALDCLSVAQQADGSFGGYDEEGNFIERCGDTARVVTALCALNIDPQTDERFVKDCVSVLEALESFGISGGGFVETADGTYDQTATEQGYVALTAYARYLQDLTSFFDMSDELDEATRLNEPLELYIGDDTENDTEEGDTEENA